MADEPLPSDPYALFTEWFALAEASEPSDPNAMTIATVDAAGNPSARIVLMKARDERGIVFYTNLQSMKGDALRATGRAEALFHWKSLRRQIRIEGPLIEVTPEAADAYFHSRPYKSQVGSAASDQSRPLPDRQTYLDRVQDVWAAHEADGKVPRPPHWTGFTLSPRRIEFWIDRDNRLHDRREFTRTAPDAPWSDTLLYP